jgi:pyrophosphatase PpaX
MTLQNHIIFDLDGTLIDSTPLYRSYLETILADHGVELNQNEFLQAVGMTASQYLKLKIPPDAINEALAYIHKQSFLDIPNIKLFDGIDRLITNLHQDKTMLAVLTNRDRQSTVKILKCLSIEDKFDLVVSADCVPNPKPHPDGLLHIAKTWKQCPSRLIMVGDHDVDMLAAKSAGSRSIRANWNGHDSEFTCPIGDVTLNLAHHLMHHL